MEDGSMIIYAVEYFYGRRSPYMSYSSYVYYVGSGGDVSDYYYNSVDGSYGRNLII